MPSSVPASPQSRLLQRDPHAPVVHRPSAEHDPSRHIPHVPPHPSGPQLRPAQSRAHDEHTPASAHERPNPQAPQLPPHPSSPQLRPAHRATQTSGASASRLASVASTVASTVASRVASVMSRVESATSTGGTITSSATHSVANHRHAPSHAPTVGPARVPARQVPVVAHQPQLAIGVHTPQLLAAPHASAPRRINTARGPSLQTRSPVASPSGVVTS